MYAFGFNLQEVQVTILKSIVSAASKILKNETLLVNISMK